MYSTSASQPMPNGTYFTRSPSDTPTPLNVKDFGRSQIASVASPAGVVTLCSSTTDRLKVS